MSRRSRRKKKYPKISIYPITLQDQDTNQIWRRLIVEYKASSVFDCYLDLDETDHIFLLKDAVDFFIEQNNLKRHEK